MRFFDKMERKYLDVVEGKVEGWGVETVKFFLYLISSLYRVVLWLRNSAYDVGVFSSRRPLETTIVSIGNIALGGTGKTPMAYMLSKKLAAAADHQAILSRGYRSAAEKKRRPFQVSRGHGPEVPASECGDEPFLLARSLPEVRVFVGRNRRLAAEMAVSDGAELLILDDGMQHRQLGRDFELVIFDGRRAFSDSYLFPRGLLREGYTSLARADLIVLNNCEDGVRYNELCREIGRYSAAPVIAAVPRVVGRYWLDGSEIETLRGRRAAIFCGIGNPKGFIATVLEEGATIVDSYLVGDHRKVEPFTLEEYALRCSERGAEMILCTEKDAVKLEGKTMSLSIPIAWIKIELEVNEGESYWEAFIEKVLSHIETMKH